ncbi:hypothetical protein ABES02_29560 [Neobacillus pocheonensis]|uniref:hypothetical protein n=1 Tax=Neobacillus pocheonensis TaxID=363869 RepID=UPI003D278013
MKIMFSKEAKKRIGKAVAQMKARQNRIVKPQLPKLINHWKHVSKDGTSWTHVYVFASSDPDEVAEIMTNAHYELNASHSRFPGDTFSHAAIFFAAGPDRVFVTKRAGYDV